MAQPSELRNRIASAARLAGDLEERLDGILYELSRYKESPDGQLAAALPAPGAWPSPKPVDTLRIALRRDGRSQVSKDDSEPLGLSRRLTELLLLLGSGPSGADGILSFRPAAEVAMALAIRKASVFNLISRLRRKLAQQGWNPNLVQTSRSQAGSKVRFVAKTVILTKDFSS
jgi:hypothetical protein